MFCFGIYVRTVCTVRDTNSIFFFKLKYLYCTVRTVRRILSCHGRIGTLYSKGTVLSVPYHKIFAMKGIFIREKTFMFSLPYLTFWFRELSLYCTGTYSLSRVRYGTVPYCQKLSHSQTKYFEYYNEVTLIIMKKFIKKQFQYHDLKKIHS